MFEIFVYLFENYFYVEACPEPDKLARKLSAAGFEEEEISEALEWLSGLQLMAANASPRIEASNGALRIFDEEEEARLSAECRGFLLFLENAGALDASTREVIIERAMALPDLSLTLPRFKVIVLMVLWSRDEAFDTLILEELLCSEEAEDVRWH